MRPTPTIDPSSVDTKSVASISFQPRKAPIIASIFTSPKPRPSSWRTRNHTVPRSHSEPPPTTTPISESSQPGGMKTLETKPTTMPGTVISFGRRWCSRSTKNSTIMAQPNTMRWNSSGGS